MTTDQCVADQGAAGAPFYAHYDVQGIDSRVAFGVVRDPSGQTSVLLWDSDPSGGSGAPGRITENVCGGDPPVQTQLTDPGSPPRRWVHRHHLDRSGLRMTRLAGSGPSGPTVHCLDGPRFCGYQDRL